jgi:hypothetical protein
VQTNYPNATNVSLNSNVSYSCADGYELAGQIQQTVYVNCDKNTGEFGLPNPWPICNKSKCKILKFVLEATTCISAQDKTILCD